MNNDSYFLVPTDIIYRGWWKDTAAVCVFFFLLADAFLRDQETHSGLVVKRGQWLGWVEEIANKTGLPAKGVAEALKKLERFDEIRCERAGVWWLITVKDFELYQEAEEDG